VTASSATISKTVLEHLGQRALTTHRANVALSDVVVRALSTEVLAGGAPASFMLLDSATSFSRVTASSLRAGGFFVAGGSVTLADTILLGASPSGAAIFATSGSTVTVARVGAETFFAGAVLIERSRINGTDLSLRSLQRDPNLPGDRPNGLAIVDGRAELSRVALSQIDGNGVAVPALGSLVAADLDIADVAVHGLYAQDTAIALERTRIARAGASGVSGFEKEAFIDASDLIIEGAFEDAFALKDGAQAKLRRVRFSDFGRNGLLIDGSLLTEISAFADVEDAMLFTSRAVSRCEERGPQGVTVKGVDAGLLNLRLARFLIDGSAVAISVEVYSEVELYEGTVENNAIGLKVRQRHERRHLFDTLFFGNTNCRALVWSD
jgi:hypothetical protein